MPGAVLLVAAGLKLFAPAQASESAVLSSYNGRVLAISTEIVVGSWLVSGVAIRGAWLAGVLHYSIFAAVSAALTMLGQSSCGCAGRLVPINPLYTLTFDLLAIGLLSTTYPRQGRWLGPVGPLFFGTCAVLVATYVGLSLLGDPRELLATMVGQTVAIDPETISVSPGRSGDHRDVTFTVANLSGRQLRLIGGTSDCSCIATDALPLEIAPGKTGEVPVRLTILGTPGLFTRQYELYTDAPGL